MSANDANKSDLGKYLIDLIANQDHVGLKWLQFLITIEAGLVVAFGFLVKPSDTARQLLPRFMVYVIPVVGFAVALALTWIVIRERKWQAWYVGRFNALPEYKDKVFPSDKSSGNTVSAQPLGRISQIVICLGVLIMLAWIFILGWAVRS